jgi:hypothetical protein
VAGGVIAVIALLLKGERSALVWVAAVFGLVAFLVFIVFLPFLFEYLLYVLHSPWYSP